MTNLQSSRTFLTLLAVVIIFAGMSQAATAEAPQWRKIHLQNIRPDMMAYWLDSAHQKAPAEYQQNVPLSLEQLPENTRPQLAKPSTRLFAAVLAADDSKGDLWILSTKDVSKQMKEMVKQLDKAIPSINISLKMVEMDSESLKTLHGEILEPQKILSKKGEMTIETTGIMPNDFEDKLDKLVAQGKAKIINASHVTTLSSFPGMLNSYSFTSMTPTISKATETGALIVKTDTDKAPQSYRVNRMFASVTPVCHDNDDHTINLFLRLFTDTTNTQQTPPGEMNNPWIENAQKNAAFGAESMTTQINLKDNHTMILTGNDSTALGIDDKNESIVFFLTANRVE